MSSIIEEKRRSRVQVSPRARKYTVFSPACLAQLESDRLVSERYEFNSHSRINCKLKFEIVNKIHISSHKFNSHSRIN